MFQDDFVGMMSIEDHEDAISDAAFSPDGTALATASLDGQVNFFVYFQLFVYFYIIVCLLVSGQVLPVLPHRRQRRRAEPAALPPQVVPARREARLLHPFPGRPQGPQPRGPVLEVCRDR